MAKFKADWKKLAPAWHDLRETQKDGTGITFIFPTFSLFITSEVGGFQLHSSRKYSLDISREPCNKGVRSYDTLKMGMGFKILEIRITSKARLHISSKGTEGE
jgi:hypothetical protein